MKKVNYIVKPDLKAEDSFCFWAHGEPIQLPPTPTPISIPVTPCSSNTCYDCYFI